MPHEDNSVDSLQNV